jgi:uncharacterized protein YjbI with pentapeptide repeats
MSEKDISTGSGFAPYTRWVRLAGFFFAPFWLALLIVAFFAIYKLIITADLSIPPDELRWLALSFTGLLAALGGLISLPIATIRIFVAERQTRTAEDQRKTANQQWETANKAQMVAEQGLITDRFTKAIGQLGEIRTVTHKGETTTEPNLEVRLGGIYVLSRIAKDSERDRVPTVEILCSYIRQNSGEIEARSYNQNEFPAFSEWIQSLGQVLQIRTDIAAALRASALRANDTDSVGIVYTDAKFRLDLTYVNLQRRDLSYFDLSKANVSHGRFEGSIFLYTNLKGSAFGGARLQGAQFKAAKMNNAHLAGANLTGANLENSDFRYANFDCCVLEQVIARSTNFSGATDMTQKQVNAIFGDEETIIPKIGADSEKLKRTNLMICPPLKVRSGPDPEYDDWLARGAPPGVPIE